MSLQVLCPLFNQIACFFGFDLYRFFCIFCLVRIVTPHRLSHLQIIVSHSLSCFFIWLMFLAAQKLFLFRLREQVPELPPLWTVTHYLQGKQLDLHPSHRPQSHPRPLPGRPPRKGLDEESASLQGREEFPAHSKSGTLAQWARDRE